MGIDVPVAAVMATARRLQPTMHRRDTQATSGPVRFTPPDTEATVTEPTTILATGTEIMVPTPMAIRDTGVEEFRLDSGLDSATGDSVATEDSVATVIRVMDSGGEHRAEFVVAPLNREYRSPGIVL